MEVVGGYLFQGRRGIEQYFYFKGSPARPSDICYIGKKAK